MCPNITGTKFMYAGRTSGSIYLHKGGVANCDRDSSYFAHRSGTQTYADYLENNIPDGPPSVFHSHNVPCAVCYVHRRKEVLILQGKTTCPPSWTMEYNGYLMPERYNHHRRMHVCVDRNPEIVPGGAEAQSGDMFYHFEATSHGKELACAVCTK